MAKRKVEVTVGDVIGVPLKDGWQAIAQVIERMDSLGAALCALYSYKIGEVGRDASFSFDRKDVVAVLPVTTRPILKREWETLGNASVANADLCRVLDGMRETRFVGLIFPNTNTVEALMNACHGLEPWEIGADTEYLRRLLYRQS